jgi:hypothetical protein
MKTLKKFFASTILILAICVPFYAGDIHVPANTAPPPTPATCSNCEPSYEVQTSDASSSAGSENLQTSEFAVDLLLALLSFF